MKKSRFRAVLLRLVVAIALTFGWSVHAPVSVSAAGNCASFMFEFAGWWSSSILTGNEPEGAKASLTYQSAAVCQAGNGNQYAGWVMIAGNNQAFKYIQSGFMFDGNPLGCMRHFSQWQNTATSGNPHTQTGSCVSGGELHTPMVKYVAGTGGHVQMWIDSVLFDTTNFCLCDWPHPFMVEYFGETHDINGDVPGYSTTKTDWNSMQIQYVSDRTWHGTCGTITLFKAVTSARYASDAPSCNHVRSWTASP